MSGVSGSIDRQDVGAGEKRLEPGGTREAFDASERARRPAPAAQAVAEHAQHPRRRLAHDAEAHEPDADLVRGGLGQVLPQRLRACSSRNSAMRR